jgi:hypothetical protein
MAEDDKLTLAPVLIENLNAVFGLNRAHDSVPFLQKSQASTSQ